MVSPPCPDRFFAHNDQENRVLAHKDGTTRSGQPEWCSPKIQSRLQLQAWWSFVSGRTSLSLRLLVACWIWKEIHKVLPALAWPGWPWLRCFPSRRWISWVIFWFVECMSNKLWVHVSLPSWTLEPTRNDEWANLPKGTKSCKELLIEDQCICLNLFSYAVSVRS